MAEDRQNAAIYAGDDAILSVSVKDEKGNPLPLAGASFSWVLATSAGSTPVITKTSAAGGIVLTHQASGVLSIYIGHGDTTAFKDQMWHQLVMTDSLGNVSTVTTGTITFKTRT